MIASPHPFVSAQVTFFYYKDLSGPERFYGETLGLLKTFDKGWVKFFRVTETSFIALVDEKKGYHKVTTDKCVMLSIETTDLEGWYARMKAQNVEFLIHLDLGKPTMEMVNGFLMRDPGGYTVEIFRFNWK